MATFLYCRVSTRDQNPDLQRIQAEAAGYTFDVVLSDHGVSGISTRLAERPEGRRLFDMLRAGDTLVVRWVDRLGRNYEDVTETIREFMRRGVIIRTIINAMTFDGATKDPVQKAVRDALIAFMAASAEAQAEATKDAQRAGIVEAKAAGEYRGRKPSFTRQQVDMVRDMLGQNASAIAIANATKLSRQTVYRIKDDPAAVEAALATWGA
jgi:putative DNA-invertase from lambdoid prophage Rac